MSKLHELIPVESDRVSVAEDLVKEAVGTFTKKTDHFTGQVRTLTMFAEDREGENTSDVKEVVTTVDDKLNHVWFALSRAMDVSVSKENTNTMDDARGDVIVDGQVVLSGVPVTALLGLERQMRKLKDLYMTIPTLDPSFTWEEDPSRGPGIFKTAHPQEGVRTEKVLKYDIVYEATENHPAQVEKYTQDMPVGKIVTDKFSGMISPAQKARLIGRINDLEIAIKEARQRANMAEVAQLPVGDAIRDFIHG